MSEKATEDQVKDFMNLTGLPVDQAKYLLEACGNNMEVALNLHHEGGAPMPSAVARPPPTGPCDTSSSSNNNNDKKKEDKKPDSANDMYVGGGQAVVMGDSNASNKTKDLMEAAKALGAVTPAEASARDANWGAGRRLGSLPSGESAPSAPTGEAEDVQVVITTWSNGFCVDDGPLRDPEQESSIKFLNDLKTGVVPQEIIDRLKKDNPGAKRLPDVVFTLKDNTSQPYEEPKKVFKAFTGSGRTMGGGSTASTDAAPAQPAVLGQLPSLDSSKPSTSIQVCLPDGTKMTARLNLSHTIADLASFVHHSRPGQPPFKLMTPFPRKDLTDYSATIESEGLQRAVVNVHNL
eukprot:TRINITY_DN8864_c0_g1_i1.p1 TRINITY_DN8864_c0_g1~~TRINITY_DN8864_c0_g1_i1.p1  ORF type:complete len:349 (+),score=79.32 TRINITY_DN8864_c0_g1_i1:48-1094(+)